MRRLEAPAVKMARGRGKPVTSRTALPPRKRPQPGEFRPGEQHPDEYRRDLNPDAMAGQNERSTPVVQKKPITAPPGRSMRTICCARSTRTASSCALKSASRASPASLTSALPALPVAQTSSVSLVEVSPSTVMQNGVPISSMRA